MRKGTFRTFWECGLKHFRMCLLFTSDCLVNWQIVCKCIWAWFAHRCTSFFHQHVCEFSSCWHVAVPHIIWTVSHAFWGVAKPIMYPEHVKQTIWRRHELDRFGSWSIACSSFSLRAFQLARGSSTHKLEAFPCIWRCCKAAYDGKCIWNKWFEDFWNYVESEAELTPFST